MAGRGRVACRFFAASGSCPYGAHCNFLHATRDRSSPSSYRTNPAGIFFGASPDVKITSADPSAMAPWPPREASASAAQVPSSRDSDTHRPPSILPTPSNFFSGPRGAPLPLGHGSPGSRDPWQGSAGIPAPTGSRGCFSTESGRRDSVHGHERRRRGAGPRSEGGRGGGNPSWRRAAGERPSLDVLDHRKWVPAAHNSAGADLDAAQVTLSPQQCGLLA